MGRMSKWCGISLFGTFPSFQSRIENLSLKGFILYAHGLNFVTVSVNFFFQTTLFSAMMESHQRLKMCSESEQLFPLTKLSTRHKGKTKSLLLQQIFRAFFLLKKA